LDAATTCWSLWLCRNDLVFEKTCLVSLAHGLFGNPLATYMGYPPIALHTGFGVEVIATVDVFSPGHMGGI
jgi:hypothetical protein